MMTAPSPFRVGFTVGVAGLVLAICAVVLLWTVANTFLFLWFGAAFGSGFLVMYAVGLFGSIAIGVLALLAMDRTFRPFRETGTPLARFGMFLGIAAGACCVAVAALVLAPTDLLQAILGGRAN